MFAKQTRRAVVIITGFLLLTHCMVGAQNPVKLTFLFRGGELQQQLVERWVSEFESQNPHITIEWQVAGSDWWNQLAMSLVAGVGPDVFESWGSSPRSWAEQGFLLDLQPYVDRDFTEEDIDDFFPANWEGSVVTTGPYTGLRYGIPSYANVFAMYYNKNMFAEAGIPFLPELDAQGLWTWEGLLDIGKKLTKRNADGQIVTWALDDDSIMHPTGRGAGWIHAAGGKIFDLPDNPTHFMLDQPEAISALEFLQDLIWKYEIVSPMDTRGQANFSRGNSAMNLWMGTTYMNTLERNAGSSFEWDLGPRPMGAASRGYYLASDIFAINGNTKYSEEAWEFVKYLTSTEGMIAHMEVMGRGPVRRSAYPHYSELYSNRSTIYHIEGMLDGVLSPESLIPKADEVARIIRDAVRTDIVPNLKSPKQAIDDIADVVRAVYQ